jgi:hypothetical protein
VLIEYPPVDGEAASQEHSATQEHRWEDHLQAMVKD